MKQGDATLGLGGAGDGTRRQPLRFTTDNWGESCFEKIGGIKTLRRSPFWSLPLFDGLLEAEASPHKPFGALRPWQCSMTEANSHKKGKEEKLEALI